MHRPLQTRLMRVLSEIGSKRRLSRLAKSSSASAFSVFRRKMPPTELHAKQQRLSNCENVRRIGRKQNVLVFNERPIDVQSRLVKIMTALAMIALSPQPDGLLPFSHGYFLYQLILVAQRTSADNSRRSSNGVLLPLYVLLISLNLVFVSAC